jgi:hypothetical protein
MSIEKKKRVLRTIKVSYYIALFFFCLLTAYILGKTAAHGLIAFIVIATFVGSSLTCYNKWEIR